MKESLIWDAALADRLQKALEGVQYGTVQIVIHDGKVVQIERTEKFRLDKEKRER